MKRFCKSSRKEFQWKQGRIASAIVICCLTFIIFLSNWVRESIDLAHIPPGVEKINIPGESYNAGSFRDAKRILSSQTGLCQNTIEKLLIQGREEEIQMLQERYFAPVSIKAQQTTPLTVSEWLVNEQGEMVTGMPLVDLQDGDILITKNSRFLGWRNGHAGLVIDAKKGLVLEAIMLGTDTKLSSVKKWSTYPSFLVLRLKDVYGGNEGRQKEAQYIPNLVAEYAKENLQGIPYGLLAGVSDRLSPGKRTAVKSTQCAHLVWYAYKEFGVDLDSDGGLLVTPFDIQNSEYLEVIQSYGY